MKGTHGTERRISLKRKLRNSYLFIIGIMVIPTVYSIVVSTMHRRQYDHIITNVNMASEINQLVTEQIPQELWEVVAGLQNFYDGNQYKLLRQVDSDIKQMLAAAESQRTLSYLHVISRARTTLSEYIDRLGTQIADGSSVAANEASLDEIRGITALISDILQEFIVSEIEAAAVTNTALHRSSIALTVIQVVITLLAMLISIRGFNASIQTIHGHISDMEELSSRIAQGDLSARLGSPRMEELQNLSRNMNLMAESIARLIQQNIAEQKNLQKAEMKALQAQITPHFLYNTLDTIIWLAEENQTAPVIQVTRAFSDFLRISLSRGHEWITVRQELDHVQNYLTIQKVRYADILTYEIDADESAFDFSMLKLSLQPLVENAIYHGIKNKRGRGRLAVRVRYADDRRERLLFEVCDNGAGFTAERLVQVYEELQTDAAGGGQLSSVYGLYNVNKRLILYYANETDGLHIESERGKGTRVYFTVPCKARQAEENV